MFSIGITINAIKMMSGPDLTGVCNSWSRFNHQSF